MSLLQAPDATVFCLCRFRFQNVYVVSRTLKGPHMATPRPSPCCPLQRLQPLPMLKAGQLLAKENDLRCLPSLPSFPCLFPASKHQHCPSDCCCMFRSFLPRTCDFPRCLLVKDTNRCLKLHLWHLRVHFAAASLGTSPLPLNNHYIEHFR